ncbi:mitochondrial inner membrane protease subunit 1 isoform X1 [Cynoglossus semilaevis]|uniref:Mitochondrial inner membrane protease subunit n=1 Tax=Cynoglossus semilaevis TaxID=244447 RepID=A0A3P8WDQ2_CYNSE|nr:mitochondrial inner membrane protease subunit 1 isoform X1 [Cynoglossus semilaevis]
MFRRAMWKTLGFVGYTVQYGCIAHCAFEYIGEFVVCSGPSMEPTIVNHDIVFSERMSRHLCRIQKGDVVVAKSPFDPNMNICKRVIGLEGDKICTSMTSDLFKTHTYACGRGAGCCGRRMDSKHSAHVAALKPSLNLRSLNRSCRPGLSRIPPLTLQLISECVCGHHNNHWSFQPSDDENITRSAASQRLQLTLISTPRSNCITGGRGQRSLATLGPTPTGSQLDSGPPAPPALLCLSVSLCSRCSGGWESRW